MASTVLSHVSVSGGAAGDLEVFSGSFDYFSGQRFLNSDSENARILLAAVLM
ncbi:hypothetical protein [Streptomyces sp. TLI_053]|uniref:hypothetical protein n=1 Tax=Streptomyces sp. TLI_053 TaxID=1855352 RepID=UPI001352085C|nr:hypothetical protein [Streptomyces sp. TLI_053]